MPRNNRRRGAGDRAALLIASLRVLSDLLNNAPITTLIKIKNKTKRLKLWNERKLLPIC